MSDLKKVVTPEHYMGMEEWYMPVIRCPKCAHKNPAQYTKFCNSCGVGLKLTVKVEQLVDRECL